MIQNSEHPWAAFLYARKIAIDWLAEDGKGDKEIARTLSMDTMQVTLIRMTPVEPVEQRRCETCRYSHVYEHDPGPTCRNVDSPCYECFTPKGYGCTLYEAKPVSEAKP